MQYPVQLLLLFTVMLAKPDQSTAAAAVAPPKALIPYTPVPFGASPDLVRKQLEDISGAAILASSLSDQHFTPSDQSKMVATFSGATKLPDGFIKGVYQGPPTESKVAFSSCKYIPVDKNTNKGKVAGIDVVPICECTGFVYDPTGFKVVSGYEQLIYLGPAGCQSGVVCNGTTAYDGKSGCGTPAQFNVKSGGHDGGEPSGASGLQLHPFALPLTVFRMTFLGLVVAHV